MAALLINQRKITQEDYKLFLKETLKLSSKDTSKSFQFMEILE